MERMKQFEKDLTSLINRNCIDNEIGTPDFILAGHLVETLNSLRKTNLNRDKWFSAETSLTNPNWPCEKEAGRDE